MIDADNREQDEIELMLPWYEAGTLSPAEMRRVGAYLAAHPDMGARLALVREELSGTIAANEALGMPSHAARDRLMAQIAAEAGAAPQMSGLTAWWKGWLPAGFSPGLSLAAAAAALIIIVQAVALVSLAPRDTDNRLAAGDQLAAASGTFILIRFAENASAGEIAALLQSIGGAIVDGPKPGGVYKLRISPRALTVEERDAIIARLREKTDLVTFLAPSG